MIGIPFNFKPESSSVKTSSYTIPAGKYALVTAQVSNGGTFTIGGSTALSSNVKSVSTVAVGLTAYTVPSGKIFKGQAGCSTGAVTINGSAYVNILEGITLGAGAVVNTNGSGFFISGIEEVVTSENETREESFWVKSGTIINGSGSWKATVQEYNEIS